MTRKFRPNDMGKIASFLRTQPHPAGNVPFVEKFEVGDRVVLRNGKETTITGVTRYGDYTVEGVSGGIPGKMLKRAPP
jgi:hypothetical protein